MMILEDDDPLDFFLDLTEENLEDSKETLDSIATIIVDQDPDKSLRLHPEAAGHSSFKQDGDDERPRFDDQVPSGDSHVTATQLAHIVKVGNLNPCTLRLFSIVQSFLTLLSFSHI